MRRLIGWGVLVLSLACLPDAGWAQVTMETHLGLQGTVRLEKWNRLIVNLHNVGVTIEGTLRVKIWRGSEYRKDLHVVHFTREIRLPHRARKRFVFTVPIASTSHPVAVSLQSAGTLLAQQKFNLREALSAEHVIVGLTSDLSLDFLSTMFQRHTRVAYQRISELPLTWSGYDSVTAVVAKGISLQAATERQWTALQQWIIRGGTLVVGGDSQVRLLQESRVKSLLPVTVLGSQAQDGLPILAAHYQVPVPTLPVIMLRARLRTGSVVVGTAKRPLLAQRQLGNGRVVFLAVDYALRPLDTWSGNKLLWKDILQPTDDIHFDSVFASLGLLDNTHPIIKLLSRPILSYPSHLWLIGMLAGYCSTLGGVFWWMSRRRAYRVRCWWAVALIVLVSGLTAYTIFPERGLREQALLYDLSTMEVFAEADHSRIRGYLGVFSSRGGVFDLNFQHPTTLLHHTFHRGAGNASKRMEIIVGKQPAIQGVRLGAWALRVFSLESMVLTPLEVIAERHASGMTIRVHNRGDVPLRGAAVIYQGRVFPLGTVAAGEETFEDLYTTLQPAENQHETAWQALFKRRPRTGDARSAYLQEVLLQHHFGEIHLAEASHTPFLAGWLHQPAILATSSDDALRVHGMTFVVSRFTQGEK